MKTYTYITEIVKRTEKEYGFFEGPQIMASSWQDAERQAREKGVTLIGQLACYTQV